MTTAIARRPSPGRHGNAGSDGAARGEGRAPGRVQIAVATSPAYREWAQGLAKSLRLPISLTVDHALAALAAAKGYPAPPPRRASPAGPGSGHHRGGGSR